MMRFFYFIALNQLHFLLSEVSVGLNFLRTAITPRRTDQAPDKKSAKAKTYGFPCHGQILRQFPSIFKPYRFSPKSIHYFLDNYGLCLKISTGYSLEGNYDESSHPVVAASSGTN